MAFVGLVALAAGALVATSGSASAGGPTERIEVTTAADVVDAEDGVISLREAFDLANEQPGDDTIVLVADPGAEAYELTPCPTSSPGFEGVDDTNALGDLDHLDPDGALTILGDDHRIHGACDRVIDDHGTGVLNLTNLTLSDTNPLFGLSQPGGGVRAVGNVIGSSVVLRNNSVFESRGGALHTEGDVMLADSLVAHNSADSGAGISALGVVLFDTTFKRNTAGGVSAGGDVHVFGSTFLENGAITTSRGGGGSAIGAGGSVNVEFSVFTGNAGGDRGGAIEADGPVHITESRLKGNVASVGGGAVYSEASVRLHQTMIRANRAPRGGGVLAAEVTVVDSTIDGNGVARSFLGDVDARGGGIYAVGDISLRDSTVSGNYTPAGRSGSAGRGGGLLSERGLISVRRSTVVGNTGDHGANVRIGGSLETRASVIGQAIGGPSCWGPGVGASDGFNVTDRTGRCGLGDGIGDRVGVADLGLGPLADNGGTTLTHRPTGTTLSVIPPAWCPAGSDQRGVPRPQGPRCEAGSVEVR